MPNIDSIKGIKINVYNGEHLPPHFHAIYNEFEVLILIQTGEIYVGYLPSNQMKIVNEWLRENSDWVLEVYFELNPKLR